MCAVPPSAEGMRSKVMRMPGIPAPPRNRAHSDQSHAALTPTEIRVSIVAAPWRALVKAARWNGKAPHTTTGEARVRASHCQLSNCNAGIIDSSSTGRLRTAEISNRCRSAETSSSTWSGVVVMRFLSSCAGSGAVFRHWCRATRSVGDTPAVGDAPSAGDELVFAGLVQGRKDLGIGQRLVGGDAHVRGPLDDQVDLHIGDARQCLQLAGDGADAVPAGQSGDGEGLGAHVVLLGCGVAGVDLCLSRRGLQMVQERTRRAIAAEASFSLSDASSPPAWMAWVTQWFRCSSSRANATASKALVAAEIWVSTSMQYVSCSTMRCTPRT